MGIDYSIHIGPYIETKAKLVKKTFEFKTCLNDECAYVKSKELSLKKIKEKFCSFCGKEYGICSENEMHSSVDSNEIYDHLQEALACFSTENDTNCIWVSNYTVTGTSFKCDKMFWTDYSSTDILDELSFFEEVFIQQINYLKLKYETVEVKWGIFNDADFSRSKIRVNTALANELRLARKV